MISFKQYILEQNISRRDGKRGRELTINYLSKLQKTGEDKNKVTSEYLEALKALSALEVPSNPLAAGWAMYNGKWYPPEHPLNPNTGRDLGGINVDTGGVFEWEPEDGGPRVLGNQPPPGVFVVKQY